MKPITIGAMARSIAAFAVMLGVVALSAQKCVAQQMLPRQIAQAAFPSVALLVMQDSKGQPTSFGSGFVLHDGLVVTNYHVIRGAASGYCKLVGKNMTYEIAGTVAVDAVHDLAIVSIIGLKAPPLPIGNSGEVAVGDAVYAIGNPEGLEGTFSQGIVSGVRRMGNATMLQITAPISPGSSGGPILDSSGKTIGIAVATFKGGQNLNLAIPSSYLTVLSNRVSANVLPLSRKQSSTESYSPTQSTPEVDTLPSIAHLRQLAERGDASAQVSLGEAYLFGRDVPKDPAEAFKWYRKAAEHGHVYAQSMLGSFYYSGEAGHKNPGEALRWWRMAAAQGDTFAEQGLGVLYAEGAGAPKDDVEAAKWYRESAEHGNALGQLKLGAAYAFGLGVLSDYAEAARWYRKAAEQGNAFAQRLLAELYYKGRGVPQDFEHAAKWFLEAGEQDDAISSDYLGYMYATGEGVTRDYSLALKWYRKAAEHGEAVGQVGVGQLYYLGNGVRQDFTEAERWFRKAAEAGDKIAQVSLGVLYTDPKGVENYTEGAKWFRKAAEQGNESAQVHLGLLYEFGKGIPQDYVLSHMWYNLSAASPGENQVPAADRRAAVAARMTGEQIAEAQRLAREWKPKKTN